MYTVTFSNEELEEMKANIEKRNACGNQRRTGEF